MLRWNDNIPSFGFAVGCGFGSCILTSWLITVIHVFPDFGATKIKNMLSSSIDNLDLKDNSPSSSKEDTIEEEY
jgi:hypothetical protein